jgi:MFS family permease
VRKLSRPVFKLPELPLAQIERRVRLLTAGGRWSTHLSGTARRSLRWLIFDGILANISDAIINAYQSIYLMALGASRAQLGALDALANLSMPVAMVPGARLAARARQYKWLVVIPAAISRLLLLGLVLLPGLIAPSQVILLGIAIVVLRNFLNNLLNPAWTAMMGSIVPLEWRGRYFSTRNIFMGAAAFIALMAVGQLIDRVGTPVGYQWALAVAMVMGLGSNYAFSRVDEAPHSVLTYPGTKQIPLWQQLRLHKHFIALCVATGLWNFGQRIAGPFFYVFFADELKASAYLVGLSSAAATLSALPGQRIFGVLNDRKGAHWVQLLTGLIIPTVPLLWSVMTQPWQAIPVEILSGFVWAGYNLAALNLLLEMTPDEGRPSFVAVYQAAAGLGMALGAGVGGWIAEVQGYRAVFFASAAGRLFAALFFAVLFRKRPPAMSAVGSGVQPVDEVVPETPGAAVEVQGGSVDQEEG